MISAAEINKEITVLENEHPTYVSMERLACLYIVRDHMDSEKQSASAIVPHFSESEFCQSIEGKDAEKVCGALDEIMSTLQVVNPRLYDGAMRQLNAV